MFNFKTSILISSLMILTSVMGSTYNPSRRIADSFPIVLNDVIPKSFLSWTMVEENGVSIIITPEQEAALENIYDLTLSRTYIDDSGHKVMLSIAYGKEQSQTKGVHYPEVCYPAQGFKVHTNITGSLDTTFGKISVRRLTTSLGPRFEPVTYWAVVNNEVILSDYENRLLQVKYGLQGLIPDGLLFRISSITTSSNNFEKEFYIHREFVNALLTSLHPQYRLKLTGLN